MPWAHDHKTKHNAYMREWRERRKFRSADNVTFEPCDCGCGLTYLILRDDRGEAFACAGMPVDEWRKLVSEAPALVVH